MININVPRCFYCHYGTTDGSAYKSKVIVCATKETHHSGSLTNVSINLLTSKRNNLTSIKKTSVIMPMHSSDIRTKVLSSVNSQHLNGYDIEQSLTLVRTSLFAQKSKPILDKKINNINFMQNYKQIHCRITGPISLLKVNKTPLYCTNGSMYTSRQSTWLELTSKKFNATKNILSLFNSKKNHYEDFILVKNLDNNKSFYYKTIKTRQLIQKNSKLEGSINKLNGVKSNMTKSKKTVSYTSQGKNFSSSYSKLHELKLINIGLASSERIKQWAEKTLPNGKIIGQITNANTLHHKTLKPQKGGLFCERIFGPLKDFECACGKSQRPAEEKQQQIFEHQNLDRLFCPKCDVEYTWSVIRRYQLGYIQLVSPVTHAWYLKATPSYLSILLDMKKRHLEYIVYSSETMTLEYSQKLTEQQYNSPANLFKMWKKSLENKNKDDKFSRKQSKSLSFLLSQQERTAFEKDIQNISPKRCKGWRHLLIKLNKQDYKYKVDVNYNSNNSKKKCHNQKYANFIPNNFEKYYRLNKNLTQQNGAPIPVMIYIVNKIKKLSTKKSLTFLNDDLFTQFYTKIYKLAYKKIKKYLQKKGKNFNLVLSNKITTTNSFITIIKQLYDSSLKINENFQKERVQKILFYKKFMYKILNKTKFFVNKNLGLTSKSHFIKQNALQKNKSTDKFFTFLKFQLNPLSKKLLHKKLNLFLISRTFSFDMKLHIKSLLFSTTIDSDCATEDGFYSPKWNHNIVKLQNNKLHFKKFSKIFTQLDLIGTAINGMDKKIKNHTSPFPYPMNSSILVTKNQLSNLDFSKTNINNTTRINNHSAQCHDIEEDANLNVNAVHWHYDGRALENKGISAHNLDSPFKGFSFNGNAPHFHYDDSTLVNKNESAHTYDSKFHSAQYLEDIEEDGSAYASKDVSAHTYDSKFEAISLPLKSEHLDYEVTAYNSKEIYIYSLNINHIAFLLSKSLMNLLLKKMSKILNSQSNKIFKAIIREKFTKNICSPKLKNTQFINKRLINFSLGFQLRPNSYCVKYHLQPAELIEPRVISPIKEHRKPSLHVLGKNIEKKIQLFSTEFKTHKIIFINNLLFMKDRLHDEKKTKNVPHYAELKSFNLFNSKSLTNNIYCLSHRYRWSTEKDWKQFIDYFGSVPELNDSPIPTYKARIKNSQNIVNNNGITGTLLIQKLLHDLNFTELKKIDKQNRILLYELNKNLIRLKKSLKKSYVDRYKKKMFKELYKKRDALIRRTKLIRKLFRKDSTPESMILSILPVLPPDLRPIIKVGGQIAASDLNRLYQRVIYRNERLKKFLKDPATINSYEMKYAQRLLQEAVDNLIQNGNSGLTAEKDSKGRMLKSLSDVLKGKQGRFRQHLLGKRVDYSGRSVIVVGPKLKLYECGLPKEMALELFLPFIIKKIISLKLARTVIGAKTLIKNNKELSYDILREIMINHPILLNRAPTLHRLGIQAFQPKLVEGRAILLHPLVCPAFNADFDGDQMAVHLPITVEARTEAWKLMFSRNNLLSPATGEPIVLPSQDMVLGCYYLTTENLKANITQKIYFSNFLQVLKAYKQGKITVHTIVWVRYENVVETGAEKEQPIEIRINKYGYWQEIYKKTFIRYDFKSQKLSQFIKTTPGRILFNELIKNSIQTIN